MTPFLTTALPIIGEIGKNILQGINERKARLYNSPLNQIKRLNEAGLPKAAASNISAGGGTVLASNPAQDLNNNLSSSITRQVDRKRLEILQQELREKKAIADEKVGEVQNKLNPAGKFEPTNQGTNMMQTLQTQEEAIKGARIINKWMPTEKYQNVLKQSKEIEQIAASTRNTIAQHGILLSEGKIKGILADYQERMSLNELKNLIRRNTGISKDNQLKDIAINLEWQTLLSKVTLARNAAQISGQTLEAAQLGNILTNLSLPSTRAYYQIRRGMDDATISKPNLPNTLLYLGMFQPNTSNYNLGNLMPSINIGGDRQFNTHNYLPNK